jgi:hypothetical protein
MPARSLVNASERELKFRDDYNHARPHNSLDHKTPDELQFSGTVLRLVTATGTGSGSLAVGNRRRVAAARKSRPAESATHSNAIFRWHDCRGILDGIVDACARSAPRTPPCRSVAAQGDDG